MEKMRTLRDLEDTVASVSKRDRTEVAILGSVAIVGFLGAALLFPNAVRVLERMVPDVRPVSKKQSVRRAIGRLIQKEYIRKSGEKYRLTEKGKERLEKILLTKDVRTKVQNIEKKKWDGKWRVVIFDIQESKRAVRDELRALLLHTGFVKMQDSVWVYPFRCDEVIALLKFKLTLGWDLVYIVADAIEGDSKLRKHFNLHAE